MRRSFSFLVAAAFGFAGAGVSTPPAQAGVPAAPSVVTGTSDSGIVQVHKRKRHHRHRRGKVIYLAPYAYYPAPYYHSYGYGGPIISFSFGGFGGHHLYGGRHHFRYHDDDGYHRRGDRRRFRYDD